MENYGQFHDGYLEGLWIEGKTVHVFVRNDPDERFGSDAGLRFTIVAEGVAALSAHGFREGNIILDVATRQASEIVANDIAELYDLQEGSADEEQVLKKLAKARQQGLTLLEINPSYGASCVILARSVELLPRNDWLRKFAPTP